jgi:hypothetical protein
MKQIRFPQEQGPAIVRLLQSQTEFTILACTVHQEPTVAAFVLLDPRWTLASFGRFIFCAVQPGEAGECTFTATHLRVQRNVFGEFPFQTRDQRVEDELCDWVVQQVDKAREPGNITASGDVD